MTSDRSEPSTAPIEHLTIVSAPGLFVILWASGFIGAKLGLPYAEPLTFLFLRMFGAVFLLGIIVLIAGPNWPTRDQTLDSCATGVFMHALYLGGVYISIANGLPAALSALIVGLQPLLTSTIVKSPARRAGGRSAVGWPTPRNCGRISRRSGQSHDRRGYAGRVNSVASSSAKHHVRYDLSEALR
jgi:hypothetical protein